MSTNKELRNKIANLDDLLNEIDRISILREEQEQYLGLQVKLLKHKVEAPVRFVNMITSHVPGVNRVRDVVSSISANTGDSGGKSDWLTKVLRLVTPLVLNRTLLKNAGWFKKAIFTVASETAVSQVSQSSISGAVAGIANFIRPKNKVKKTKLVPGEITAEEAVEGNKYGIPKDSEAY